ncbi:methyl-accepting chemotaxis protein, partial [Novosphingobium pokkalii]|uniref:methyl-accepting chemotaxis protein n=1 Tax=Novosphingobium pokkalii TaxID=1770194 RepID=UPI001749E129
MGAGLATLLLGAAALALVALWRGWQPRAPEREPSGVTGPEPEPVADTGGLAFLSDPFAIPPPVLADMQAVQPFVDTLCGQIEGIQADVADGVVNVVRRVESISTLSAGQRDRIFASLAGAQAMREAVAMPGEIVARLGHMLAERDRRIAENFAGLQALAGEFQALRDTVDVISQVADKAFFLAINASVEAHHQGRAGLAFGLIATEMRSLASQTADGARQVGQSIHTFSDRMHAQIAAAMPGAAGKADGAGGGAGEMGALLAELGTAQERALEAAAQLDTAMQTLDTGHAEIVRSLSDILGNLQFQDVMRQRLEQIFGALRELEDLIAQSTSGAPPTRSLLDVLEQQRALCHGKPAPGAWRHRQRQCPGRRGRRGARCQDRAVLSACLGYPAAPDVLPRPSPPPGLPQGTIVGRPGGGEGQCRTE